MLGLATHRRLVRQRKSQVSVVKWESAAASCQTYKMRAVSPRFGVIYIVACYLPSDARTSCAKGLVWVEKWVGDRPTSPHRIWHCPHAPVEVDFAGRGRAVGYDGLLPPSRRPEDNILLPGQEAHGRGDHLVIRLTVMSYSL